MVIGHLKVIANNSLKALGELRTENVEFESLKPTPQKPLYMPVVYAVDRDKTFSFEKIYVAVKRSFLNV